MQTLIKEKVKFSKLKAAQTGLLIGQTQQITSSKSNTNVIN